MRSTRLTTKFTASALGLVLAAAMLAAPVPARAADDDVAFDSKILRGILEGIGLRKDGEGGINYQERAPLVIPPSRALPPPEKGDVALSNPAWPKDPDVIKRKKEVARERRGTTSQEVEAESRPLRPEQLTPGGDPRTLPRGNEPRTDSARIGDRLSPAELGAKGGIFGKLIGQNEEATVKFTGEPPRASLTAPPPGYQTPSPNQPYGPAREDRRTKAFDYEHDRATEKN